MNKWIKYHWLSVIMVVVIWVLGVMVGRNLYPHGSETEQNEAALSIVSLILTFYVFYRG